MRLQLLALQISIMAAGAENLEQTFFSSEYGRSSHQMQGEEVKESSLCLSAGSTLIARHSGQYGANADRTETTVGMEDSQAASGETDGAHLLSERIRQKKQGRGLTLSCSGPVLPRLRGSH